MHQENRGFSQAKNRGFEKIDSQYIMFVDSDDMLSPNAIENMLDAAKQHGADITSGNFYNLYGKKLLKRTTYRKEGEITYGKLTGFACGKIY